MFVVEGPDMVGKTTLMPFLERLACDELALREMLDRVAPRKEKFGLEESLYTTAAQWIARIRPWTIADRFALSEKIYGKVARGASNISEEAYQEVDEELVRRGGRMIVLCATPEYYEELIVRVYPTRGEAFSQETCREVNLRYLELREGRDCDTKIILDGKTGYAQERAPYELARAVSEWISEQASLE